MARWERCWERSGERLDLDHYLEVLQHKPRALSRSLPLRQAQELGRWPACYAELLRTLTERMGESAAARQMVEVLLLHRQHPAEVVHQAAGQTSGSGGAAGITLRIRWRLSSPLMQGRRSGKGPRSDLGKSPA